MRTYSNNIKNFKITLAKEKMINNPVDETTELKNRMESQSQPD